MENVKKLNRVEAKLMLPLLYETQYGIFDHTSQAAKKPMAGDSFRPAYDTHKDSILNDLCFRYEENSIFDIFHLSFFDYINLPRAVTNQLDENARSIRKKRDAVMDQANKKMKASIEGG